MNTQDSNDTKEARSLHGLVGNGEEASLVEVAVPLTLKNRLTLMRLFVSASKTAVLQIPNVRVAIHRTSPTDGTEVA